MKGNFHARFLGGCKRATARIDPVALYRHVIQTSIAQIHRRNDDRRREYLRSHCTGIVVGWLAFRSLGGESRRPSDTVGRTGRRAREALCTCLCLPRFQWSRAHRSLGYRERSSRASGWRYGTRFVFTTEPARRKDRPLLFALGTAVRDRASFCVLSATWLAGLALAEGCPAIQT